MKSVLVTGGSGFFGRGFVRACLERGVERVCIFSRGEYAQALMRQEFNDDSRLRFFIGDVRDKERLERAMHGIDVVVHAAALKRIEVGNYAPDEMVKTNVMGALNVIDAAAACGVQNVVALSTDKAWQPISPYGQSKALAETAFLNANQMFGSGGPAFSVVRYGNVWRSTGSIVPMWESKIRDGQRVVRVTDPDCTRFFMRLDQAVSLVMSSIGKRSLVIPDWLPAYRIGDLAEVMGLKTEVTGLPEWEKKHEGMKDGLTSDIARRMSADELAEELDHA